MGERLRAVAARLRGWRRTGLLDATNVADDDLRTFRDEASRAGRPQILAVTGLLTAFNVAFWCTDAWVFRATPGAAEALSRGRARVLALAVAVLVAAAPRRAPAYPIGLVAGVAATVILSSTLGDIGGPSTPWFHFLHVYLLAPAAATFSPLVRVAATLLFAACCLAAYFGPHPGYLRDPYAANAIGYFSYVAVLGIAVGWYADAQRLRHFLARRALAAERETLAARVAEATDALQRLVRHLDVTLDEERARVARELHDELGQAVTALRMVLKATRARYARDPGAVGANFEQLAELTAGLTRDTRRIVSAMRPRVLDDLGLAPALGWLAEQARERGLACEVDADGLGDAVPAPVATAVFRTTQEALTNVLEHARATRATVRVRADDGALELVVEDDGVGFDPASTRPDAFGIVGMRERAAAFGGALAVSPRAPRGTRVRATFRAEALGG